MSGVQQVLRPLQLRRYMFTVTVPVAGLVIAPTGLGDVAPTYWSTLGGARVALPATAIPVMWEIFNLEASGGETLRFMFAAGTAVGADLTAMKNNLQAAAAAGQTAPWQTLQPATGYSCNFRHPAQQVDGTGTTTTFYNALVVRGETPAQIDISGAVEAWEPTEPAGGIGGP